ncbi:MAG: DUF3330 domain-containing protein [Gammaproteobacteria bacterium]|jgi:hypothetical protein|nr:DUF3330 domain-containing protein [Gammaproteobacteria bacterium]
MISNENSLSDVQIACDVCMREIPVSEAKSEEAAEYVFYFCGPDCYEAWSSQAADNTESSK